MAISANGDVPPFESTFAAPEIRSAETVDRPATHHEEIVTVTNADNPTGKSTIQSNVRIPETLRDQLHTDRNQRGITTGELIILAIESTYDRLRSYVHPAGTVGGKLFAERGVGGLSKTAVPARQVAFSVTRADLTVLDQLVIEFSARDRAHLITAALTAFFDDTTPQGE